MGLLLQQKTDEGCRRYIDKYKDIFWSAYGGAFYFDEVREAMIRYFHEKGAWHTPEETFRRLHPIIERRMRTLVLIARKQRHT